MVWVRGEVEAPVVIELMDLWRRRAQSDDAQIQASRHFFGKRQRFGEQETRVHEIYGNGAVNATQNMQ